MSPNQHAVCLVHGAAVTPDVFRLVIPLLGGFAVAAPTRRSTGSMDAEIAGLAASVDSAIVVGMSGGATLGLELAARGAPMRAAILHEPAVGSLVPGLLAAVAAAYDHCGPAAFGAALYGPLWSASELPADPAAVARDLGMFRQFEPASPAPGGGPVLITVGADSPPVRHQAAAQLAEHFGYRIEVIEGCGHAVALERPDALAALVRRVARETA